MKNKDHISFTDEMFQYEQHKFVAQSYQNIYTMPFAELTEKNENLKQAEGVLKYQKYL